MHAQTHTHTHPCTHGFLTLNLYYLLFVWSNALKHNLICKLVFCIVVGLNYLYISIHSYVCYTSVHNMLFTQLKCACTLAVNECMLS